MWEDERLNTYLLGLETDRNAQLRALEQEAIRAQIPVIRRQTQELLKVLLQLKKPRRLLEIGGGVGFSAVFMSWCTGSGCRIVTIEKDERRAAQARENIRAAGRQEQITLLTGDACDQLARLVPGFDFVFMDAAKGQYRVFFDAVRPLLADNGLLVCDNVLQNGNVLESRYAVARRDRTIHRRMRDFLWMLTHNEDFETTILGVGDGVSVSIKKENQRKE